MHLRRSVLQGYSYGYGEDIIDASGQLHDLIKKLMTNPKIAELREVIIELFGVQVQVQCIVNILKIFDLQAAKSFSQFGYFRPVCKYATLSSRCDQVYGDRTVCLLQIECNHNTIDQAPTT